MESISIGDLRVPTRVGVSEEERSRPQIVKVSVEIDADLTRARSTDDISDTIDYHRVVTEVAALVRSSEVRLLEHLGERIAARIAEMKGVSGVTVLVTKEAPPVDEQVGAITVTVNKR